MVVGLEIVGKTGLDGLGLPLIHFVSTPKETVPAAYVLLATPHVPFKIKWAVHVADDVPPLTPAQVHVHGPVPVGAAMAVPTEQRLEVGALLTAIPLADPQAPFVGTARRAVQKSDAPPLWLKQLQLTTGLYVVGKVTVDGFGVPREHKV